MNEDKQQFSTMERNEHCDKLDTLQELCIFFLANNVDVLASSLQVAAYSESGTAFSLGLGNTLLDHYLKYSPASHLQNTTTALQYVFKKKHLCNEMSVNAKESQVFGPVEDDIVKSLSENNHFKRLDVLCCHNEEYNLRHSNHEFGLQIVLNNLGSLVALKMANLDAGFSDRFKDVIDLLAGLKSHIATHTRNHDSKQDVVANRKYNIGQQGQNNDNLGGGDNPRTVKCRNLSTGKLRTLSLTVLITGMATCYDIDWNFFNTSKELLQTMQAILDNNPQLQAFSLSVNLYQLILWFLELPILSQLLHIQSLSLTCITTQDYEGNNSVPITECAVEYQLGKRTMANLSRLQNLR